ncbi:hypothetical protein A0O34_17685 [Chryseobacterium glaciei]|uniref:Uncharacterized protein n=1 Tax=Chryseobacterium glaciei TaxID=1685010 RepID=A0A172XYZ0_9FLAO|nr:hypothetical protein [Chryseobacterium glaciei]ANF52237.1 hypothetical protein A0O34_17685 [Chryseobacterium glaciei]
MLKQKEVTKAIDVFRVNTIISYKDGLGEAYLEAVQKDKARQSYQKLLEMNPENQDVANIKKKKNIKIDPSKRNPKQLVC